MQGLTLRGSDCRIPNPEGGRAGDGENIGLLKNCDLEYCLLFVESVFSLVKLRQQYLFCFPK